MTTIHITYNPFTVETAIIYDENNLVETGVLSQFKNERFQVWVEQIIPILMDDILNEDTFTIVFQGTTPDFEDLEEVCRHFNETKGTHISLEHIQAKETEDKIKELSKIVKHMQSGPFEALKDERIQKDFEKAVNSEFEIGVIATMSSGKSTLINAMLGVELMPSKNEACTAVIAQIKNEKDREGFIGACYDRFGNEIIGETQITDEDMQRFNENEEVSTIKITGNIPGIESYDMNLVLVDTPGPNNSMNSAHRDHTYRVIKNDSKPMVLYVLNGTNLSTDDDNTLLTAVADQMRVGGKQSKDRFIFAVNKVDQFDPDNGEDVGEILENVKEYLAKHGIKNPNIFPVSAEVAKVIRMQQNGLELTRKQKSTFNDSVFFAEEPKLHLNQYSPISRSAKNHIQASISNAKAEGDAHTEALYHSGLPAIEVAINEYLEKYALTSKISNAITTFQKIIEDQQMVQSLMEELERNKEERQNMHEQMTRIEKILADGKKAFILKEKIQQLDIDITDDIERVQGKIQQELTSISNVFNDSKISKNEANSKITKSRKKIDALQSDVLTDLEKITAEYMTTSAEKLVAEYKSYVKEIVDQTGMDSMKFDQVKLLTASLPGVDELVSQHTFSKEEVVGTRTVYNDSKKWYKPWTWTQSKSYEEDEYGIVEYVDGIKLRNEFISPVKQSLDDNIHNALEHLEEQKTMLRDRFVQELDILDGKLSEKVAEIKELAKGEQFLAQQIKINEEKKSWLNDLVAQLDRILEI
ncbi:dynamin family protein [Sporosarcina sp. FSL K6-5500]|uniref:dynamin family protein n=1 Tax=Sporosarcina sp. FSL K6-5500 TaxID=2921558 RepID=UPI0030F72407